MVTWEGELANEECSDDDDVITERRNAALGKRTITPVPLTATEDTGESSSSEDEYVDEKPEVVEEKRKISKQRTKSRSTSAAPSVDTVDDTRLRRITRVRPGSPTPSTPQPTLKRKATGSRVVPVTPPAPKRKKSVASKNAANDDPARKYCLGKLEELFREVFLRYPNAREEAKEESQENKMDVEEEGADVPEKKNELSEEKKQALIDAANQFAGDLENCVFEIYSEPDKNGNPHAGGKYKERFRMLQFNLSKADRVMIHRRITSGNITAKEISLMSSTDLADEETKQSIKQAEQEALEHSILQRTTAPRAKITHKGLQDIENVNGDVPSALEVERHKEREVEEEERRERERMARLRTVQRQRTMSLSIPPESPSVQQQTPDHQWGAPPPVPVHAISPTSANSGEGLNKPPATSQASSDMSSAEPELNLADLINIDDEQEPSGAPVEQNNATQTAASNSSNTGISTKPSTATTTTGISPFAARPRNASFDLNSLWNAPKDETSTVSESEAKSNPSPEPVAESPVDIAEEHDKEEPMDIDTAEANDQDFDMFLNEDRNENLPDEVVTPVQVEQVENLPQVWTGKIAMPLDSTVPQETKLIARQIAGKPLPPDSPLWKTLFPSEQLRIEGRVPVENSVKYLMAMRLNPTKELYAAVFTANSAMDVQDFTTFCNFLISKNRHGLVFPWGSRPKDYHPGRELYMVPLLQTQALPEFVELLDNLKLPKIRTQDYLLGIWVLNKGKLAPLPTPVPQFVPPPPVPQIPSLLPPNVPTPTPPPRTPSQNSLFNAATPQSILPAVAALSQLPAAPQIAPAALAAEVASLTPEQLQEVLRTLAATSQIPLPMPNAMPPNMMPPTSISPLAGASPPPPPAVPPFPQSRPPFPPHVPTPPIASHSPPIPPNSQPWPLHPPPPPQAYPTNYPPPNVPYQQPPPRTGAPPPPPPMSYDRRDDDRDFRSGPQFSQGHPHQGHRNDYGDRGRRNSAHRSNSNRGRGGRDEGHDRDYRRNSDAGWPRRQRNDNGRPGGNW
ncbi:hypothetical protein D9613_007039 [Agrocybe pediades]|uniref:TFIIS central domain-containing protein n=1 Tax=Agrocybe pediades TaxID=84607 RepID=A0A8H4QGR8_9AGAR|nr:hypothetical protein D9613_007039 [Agrocybe pediades]